MNDIVSVTTPLADKTLKRLRMGDRVHITGQLYTARDAAHKRMWEQIQRNERLPFDPLGQIVFYVGPTPPQPGKALGSAGPTTAGGRSCRTGDPRRFQTRRPSA